MPLISVVMPCWNEEKTIGICIKKAQKAFKTMNLKGEIIVADNASSDRSAEIAKSLGAKVVFQPISGYGATYLEGLKHTKGDYIIIADSDNTYNFLEIQKFVEALEEGYDFVIGSRFRGKIEKGSMKPLHYYIGNPLLNTIFNILFYTELTDTHCGYRAFTKKALQKLDLKHHGMEFALEMIVKASKSNLKIKEVPINYYKRISPSKLNSFRDGARHLSFMLKEWLK